MNMSQKAFPGREITFSRQCCRLPANVITKRYDAKCESRIAL